MNDTGNEACGNAGRRGVETNVNDLSSYGISNFHYIIGYLNGLVFNTLFKDSPLVINFRLVITTYCL